MYYYSCLHSSISKIEFICSRKERVVEALLLAYMQSQIFVRMGVPTDSNWCNFFLESAPTAIRIHFCVCSNEKVE